MTHRIPSVDDVIEVNALDLIRVVRTYGTDDGAVIGGEPNAAHDRLCLALDAKFGDDWVAAVRVFGDDPR